MDDWLGASVGTVWAIVLSTALIYGSALLTVRLAGRRTITQLSAFDAVVTIALGSLVATTAVTRTTSYAEGLTAMVTLLALQTGLATLRQRSDRVRRLVDFEPEVLVHQGAPSLSRRPGSSQVTEEELWSRLRQKGVRLTSGTLVILEPDGSMSVFHGRALDDVLGSPPLEADGSDGT